MIKNSSLFAAYTLFLSCLFSYPTLNASLLFPFAYENILENTYEFKAADIEIVAREADRWQAGAHPNPALSVNLSSVGKRQYDDDENQLFVGVTQIVELGGKRSARLRVAGASQCSSKWNLEIVKNELFAKLLHAFIDMAAAQERLALANGQKQIAERTLVTISAKTQAGKSSGIEEKKAQVAFRNSVLIYSKQLSQLQKKKNQLISLWNINPPLFDTVSFPLFDISPPPPLQVLIDKLHGNPELIRAETESALASEIVSLERSKRVPDIAVQIGVATYQFTREAALSLGVGIPLPIFDHNEGNISRASYEQLQATYSQQDIKHRLQSTLKIIYHEWTTTFEMASMLKDSILPAANEAFQFAQESYREGKTDYLNFLDAGSTLFDVQQQYLDMVEEYHHKRAEALKLINARFETAY